MKNLLIPLIFLSVSLFMVSGCLTVEKKSYLFEINEDGSGRLTIKYINILSIRDDNMIVAEEDFEELIAVYLEGTKPGESFPDATIVSKRLFEENNFLCGEVIFEFEKIADAKLYRYDNRGPFMFCVNCSFDNEVYSSSNGTYGGEIMPVVFYEEDRDIFTLITSVSTPDDNMVSLLPYYKTWEESGR